MANKRNTTFQHCAKYPGSAKFRTGKPVRTPTFLPISRDIIVLGIDPGEIPGYAILENGEYITSGTAIDPIEKQNIVMLVRSISVSKHLPLLFIAENWPSPFLPDRRRMSHESILGMGQNWGLWLQEIQKIPKQYRIIDRIDTLEWRKFYGIQRCNKIQAKSLALPIASQIAKKEIDDHNEAEAILIANVGGYLRPKIKGGLKCQIGN